MSMLDLCWSEKSQQYLESLLMDLQRIDQLLEHAVMTAQEIYGSEQANRAYKGLYISPDEINRLLARKSGMPIFHPGESNELCSTFQSPLLVWIQQVFALSPFEMLVLLMALAPEVDLRYERLYAYLQDDVTRKRPTVDLALNLLCTSNHEKLVGRAYFAPDASLLKQRLLHLFPDVNQHKPPLLAHYFKVDEQIVRLLLDQSVVDSRIVPFCEQVAPILGGHESSLYPDIEQGLQIILRQAQQNQTAVRLYLQGADAPALRCVVDRLAQTVGVPILRVDLGQLLAATVDVEECLQILFREAWFRDIILCLEGWERLQTEENAALQRQFQVALAKNSGLVILVGQQPWTVIANPPIHLITIRFPALTVDQQRMAWQINLDQAGIQLEESEVQRLGDRFQLSHSQIAAAVAAARDRAQWQQVMQWPDSIPGSASGQPTLADLFAAARQQSGNELADLAQKAEAHYTWTDLVLAEDALTQLQEICQRVVFHRTVFNVWGFQDKLSHGRGVTVMFSGLSGTGKTMAAGIIAHELGLDLYKIELSGVVSKYIGETEKNLDRIFRAATTANAILFFDEADALFGKRSEVRDSHDRYANLEISYLLQKMEEYEGIAILATNLRQNLDEAFVRRLAFTVQFPFPDVGDRQRIWEGMFPAQVPLAEDVNFEVLANQFKFSGGNIKNVALAAAFLAAAEGSILKMSHLLQAIRREYQKMGKVLSDEELQFDS
jgi:hypothetical protein